jgi:hypothetical protein
MGQVFFLQFKIRRKTMAYIEIKQRGPQTIQGFIDIVRKRKTDEKVPSVGKGKGVQAIGKYFNRSIDGQHQASGMLASLVKQYEGQHQHRVHDQQVNGLLHKYFNISNGLKVAIKVN